jgi:hypothetical protein
LNVPVAVATPPVIVHEVGSNTAGLSWADDSGTEVCTGIVGELDARTDGEGGGELGVADVVGATGSAAPAAGVLANEERGDAKPNQEYRSDDGKAALV